MSNEFRFVIRSLSKSSRFITCIYLILLLLEVRIYVNGICALRKSNFFTPPTPPPIFPMLADKRVLPVSACFSMKKKISIRV